MAHRLFLLSPANCSGLRARQILLPRARLPLAARLRQPGGAPVGEVFSFLSSLYFRGKHAYASAFARPPEGLPGILVITASEGLLPAQESATARRLRRWARVAIDAENPRYRRPLARDAKSLARRAGPETQVVLLGSIATGKYVDVLLEELGPRLVFPIDFVGRGDMSRGGLMLRCARQGRELEYAAVAGAVRQGARPPKLSRLPGLLS